MKEKEFYKNTVIYFIGTTLSKILNILFLPFISIYLSPEEYGVYDIVQNVSSLLLPIFTFQLIEAAYRFTFNSTKKETTKTLSNIVFTVLISSVFFVTITLILGYKFYSFTYTLYIVFYYIGTMFLNLYQRISRSLGKSKEFAISGIIQTIVFLLVQYIALKYTNYKLEGIVFSYAFSIFITCIYLENKLKTIKFINFKEISFKKIKEYLKFSIPLIPNSVLWWATSSLNRIIIVYFLGYELNGIYAMSNKFTLVITMISSIITMSWQELCIKEYNAKNKEELFSKIYNSYIIIIFSATACITLVQKLYFMKFIDPMYIDAVKYIPIVMYGGAFSAMASFYGVGYIAYKKTKDSFKTTIIGAILNIILCCIGAQKYGLYGVSIGTMLGYGAIWIIRKITMKSYFNFKAERKKIIYISAITTISICTYYLSNEYISIILAIILLLIYIKIDGKQFFILKGGSNENN